MEQPKMKVTDLKKEKEYGYKKVMSLNWDNAGRLWVVTIDFMESGNTNGHLTFYKNDDNDEFTSIHGNLKGVIIF